MMSVALAVITHQRPAQLADLLEGLQAQQLRDPASWNVRIVVVDNDPGGSASEVLQVSRGPFELVSAVEPEAGIPFARQKSVDLCPNDDVVIFVDDDERAPEGWLQRLLDSWQASGADVVTGPIQGNLPTEAPAWAHQSDVYTSVGKYRTGDRVAKAYTNNTLVTRKVLDSVRPAFHPAFRYTGSSDLHFFLRVHKAGFVMVWDNEAVMTEDVPMSRLSIGWLIRRAFRSGAGDTISRRLISPGLGSALEAVFLATARILNGVWLLIRGISDPALRIKGLRRFVSGCGSFAGLVGINYEEYRR